MKFSMEQIHLVKLTRFGSFSDRKWAIIALSLFHAWELSACKHDVSTEMKDPLKEWIEEFFSKDVTSRIFKAIWARAPELESAITTSIYFSDHYVRTKILSEKIKKFYNFSLTEFYRGK